MALPPEADGPRITPVVRAVDKALPSVVNISTEQLVRVTDPFAAYFDEFFQRPARYFRKYIPLGSGVFVDPSGLVLTNFHVVRRASNIEIRTLDGDSFPGRIIAFDMPNDLALIQVLTDRPGQTFPAIALAMPDDAILGETVVAVGNPFGLGHSVTTGVLSAKNRSIREGDVVFNDILQTDAAVNPGNSGGPLINLEGRLMGINLAIRRDAEGIGFAVPLRRIEDVLATWLVPSRFSDGICGFTTRNEADASGYLAVVSTVDPTSPAAESGLKVGDRVVSVDGEAVHNSLDVARKIWQLRPGDQVVVGLNTDSQLTIPVAAMTSDQLIRHRLGLQLQELKPALRKALGLPASIQGLTVSDVLAESPFSQYEVKRGDIIFRIGNQKIASRKELLEILRGAVPGQILDVFLVTTKAVGSELFLKQFVVRVIVE